jgi:hypothetical protein
MTTGEATAPATDTRTVVRSYFEALGRADRNAQTDWYADREGRDALFLPRALRRLP